MCMEPVSTVSLPGCYIATVNESETITVAKPFCPVRVHTSGQRAAIARAVISRPQLLLADEPTGSVDPTLGRRLLRLFIELNRLGTAVIIATHDITLMDQYEARRMVLHQGRLHIYE